MSYLFYIDERAKAVLRPDCVKLCPELSGLDEEEVLFVILAFDHHSPLRRYPEADRVRRAMLQVWSDNKPRLLEAIEKADPTHYINAAINAYKSLQYDEKIELIKTYQETVEQIKTSISSELGDKEMKEKLDNIEKLRKHIKSLENEITEQIIEEGQLKGDQDLSFIENIQRKKEHYDYVTKRKKK